MTETCKESIFSHFFQLWAVKSYLTYQKQITSYRKHQIKITNFI